MFYIIPSTEHGSTKIGIDGMAAQVDELDRKILG
jgi:hypothetical protein